MIMIASQRVNRSPTEQEGLLEELRPFEQPPTPEEAPAESLLHRLVESWSWSLRSPTRIAGAGGRR